MSSLFIQLQVAKSSMFHDAENLSYTNSVIETELKRLEHNQTIPPKYHAVLRGFYTAVKKALSDAHQSQELFLKQFFFFLQLMEKQLQEPVVFQPYHRKIRSPIDYYQFGLDFIRSLIDLSGSQVRGLSIASQIEEQLRAGENVILFANHQTETDPQLISILLEKSHPILAEQMIYIAGERVVTDPLAIPFSLGCDLLCIYSKRYIDHPPELKAKKQLHNKHTMERMSRLLAEGGKVIYVAPSGGRDRRNSAGVVEVAPFDSQSLEMLYLMAKKSQTTTHFYPLTLATYELLPPPDTIQHELGEERIAKYTPIHLAFSSEFDMENFPGSDVKDKGLRRKARADAIWNIVNQEHQKLCKEDC